MIIGVSLKAYFGYAQTLTWCRQVASLIAARQPVETEVFILPSFPALAGAADLLAASGVSIGAQDLAAADAGAQTGEVTGALLSELGCRYVEVGHAERRTLFGEDETVVAAKTAAALRHGLVPVLCLGEVDRLSSEAAAAECVRQLHSALSDSQAGGLGGRLVVAYEPHWAIGAPEPAPEAHILTVCQALRDAVRALPAHPDSVVIYGGSAGPGLLSRLAHGVDGLFLGRFAHDVAALARVLDEAEQITTEDTKESAR
jgi:triosephosphate isomerase (TIM)